MEGGPVHLGAGVPTNPRPEEDLRGLQVSVLGRKVEWGRSQLQTQTIAINESLLSQRPTSHIPQWNNGNTINPIARFYDTQMWKMWKFKKTKNNNFISVNFNLYQ